MQQACCIRQLQPASAHLRCTLHLQPGLAFSAAKLKLGAEMSVKQGSMSRFKPSMYLMVSPCWAETPSVRVIHSVNLSGSWLRAEGLLFAGQKCRKYRQRSDTDAFVHRQPERRLKQTISCGVESTTHPSRTAPRGRPWSSSTMLEMPCSGPPTEALTGFCSALR